MVTVDEAHCISQWGQDFRPSYVQIPEFVAQLPQRPILSAFTATATQQVREDIFRLLNLQNPELLITGFDRTNLFFEVQHPHKKLPALLDFLYAHRGESGIIYCNTRKNVEQVCEDLIQRDINAAPYHAGLEPEQRRQSQDDFLYDRTPIMVATNAFGMGIDKSNVSFVVHYNMPMDMESYYQEAGRAGRDGSPAHCLLLYNAKDVQTNRWMIDQGSDNLYADPEQEEFLKQQGHQRLKKMTFYCTLPHCLRGYILKYFGEKPASQCDNCSNCVSESHLVDVTVESQKLISCILRMGSRYGHKMVIDVLRGENNDRIAQLGLDYLPTYGISQESEEFLRQLVNFLEGEGYLGRSEGDYPTLFVTENARAILRGEQSLSMRQFEQRPKRGKKPTAATAVAPEREELFRRLKALRKRLADLQGVPAFVVVSDKTLIDLCDKLPTNQFELLRISGIGEQKAAQYGQKFLAEIILFCQEED